MLRKADSSWWGLHTILCFNYVITNFRILNPYRLGEAMPTPAPLWIRHRLQKDISYRKNLILFYDDSICHAELLFNALQRTQYAKSSPIRMKVGYDDIKLQTNNISFMNIQWRNVSLSIY